MGALRADYGDFDPLAHTGSVRRRDGRQSLILCLLANLATLWGVLQSLIVKKYLFAGSPQKALTTVDALEVFVMKFGRLDVAGCEDFAV